MLARHFDAKSTCNRAALAEQLVENIRWWPPLSASRAGIVESPIEGADRILDLITSSYMYKENGREWSVLDFVTDGVKVAVRANLRAIVATTTEPYENDYTFFMRLDGLRISEVWEAFDSAYAIEHLQALATESQ